ncbi:hypothetical protein [Alteribacter populi]|uniref:hypothetical protein n=1 Tax=Alteribacter populi TaxID=2011011 RepID=UPI000BBAFF60|nr:hypothetical protein [Alteribacter populi]
MLSEISVLDMLYQLFGFAIILILFIVLPVLIFRFYRNQKQMKQDLSAIKEQLRNSSDNSNKI